jgi:ketosteroid isomerase-like protein
MTATGRWTSATTLGGVALTIFSLACAPALQTPAQSDTARNEVVAALNRYMLLLRTAPPDSTAAFFTSDGQLLDPGMAPLVGPAAIKAFLEPIARTFTVSEATAHAEATEVYGDSAAYQWGTYHQAAGPNGAPPTNYDGRFVVSWRRTAAGWRIARFLVQPNPPPRR